MADEQDNSAPPEPKLPPLKLVRYPADVLRAERAPIAEINYPGGIEALARDMLETMYLSRGVGLAAPQIGINARITVIDASEERDQPMVLIDPETAECSGTNTEEEGCLSVPGIQGKVKRAERVVVEFTTLDGERIAVEAQGLLSRVCQHEIDHLDGKLFIDRLGMAKRLTIKRQLGRLEEEHRRRAAEQDAKP